MAESWEKETIMTPELVAILAVGVALAAFGIAALQLLYKQFEALKADINSARAESRADINSAKAESRADISSLRTEFKADLGAVEGRISAFEQRSARLEGMFEEFSRQSSNGRGA